MSDLQRYFQENNDNMIDKWHHYFGIYEEWFSKYRNKPVVILEIGVYQGGSLKMWRHYFGDRAMIYAIDINPQCKQFEEENIQIFIGSQEDRSFLQEIKDQIPKIDILIDDGGHSMNQQIVSFEELYTHIKEDGTYLCEDLHTSYWKNYGGGYRDKNSFIEYSKKLIDQINAWHARDEKLLVNEFTRSSASLHFYPSVLVIQKKVMEKPQSERKGKMIIPQENFPMPQIKRGTIAKVKFSVTHKKKSIQKLLFRMIRKIRKIRKIISE